MKGRLQRWQEKGPSKGGAAPKDSQQQGAVRGKKGGVVGTARSHSLARGSQQEIWMEVDEGALAETTAGETRVRAGG